MSELEPPMEAIHEEIHHHAQHSRERWISWVALSSALLAALAAVTVLLAGFNANEAMLRQIESSDTWGHYQAKSIKAIVLRTKGDLLEAQGKALSTKDVAKIEEYKQDQEALEHKAKHAAAESQHFLHCHEIFARGVTMFQVAIAIAAISVLTKRTRFWFVGLAFGGLGVYFLVSGLLS